MVRMQVVAHLLFTATTGAFTHHSLELSSPINSGTGQHTAVLTAR